MLSRSLLSLILLTAVALSPVGAAADDDVFDPQAGPREGLLLLRNGHVLRGRVLRVGGRYYVVTPTGEIQVPIDQAEAFCLDMQEAYRYQLGRIDPREADDHRSLAAWCLQHQLLPQTAESLSAAERLQPNHRTTRYLRQRLQLALRPRSQPAPPPKKDPSRPSSAQLARFVKSLPPGTVETFTHRIQPLLLNRCASCHGRPGVGDFQLRRLPRGRPLDHRVTQANLFAAAQKIDAENPAQSSLLTTLLRPHGGGGALFADRTQPQYQRLAAWVVKLAKADRRSEIEAKPKAVSQSSRILLQTMMDRSPIVRSADESSSVGVAPPAEPTTPEDRSQPGARDRFTPRDPFDPELFNRRYFSSSLETDGRRPGHQGSVNKSGGKDDRRLEFGVGPRPASRPQAPRRSRDRR